MRFILFLFLLYSMPSFSQDTAIHDSPKPKAEISTAINPTDTNNIVVAVQNDFGGELNITIYYTYDFGQTWQISDYTGSTTNSNSGDPVLAFDAEGNLFLVNLVALEDDLILLLSNSSDGGKTWTQAAVVAPDDFSDKPWMAIDRYNTSPNLGNIYIPVVQDYLSLYTLDDSLKTTNKINVSEEDGDHLPSIVVRKDGTIFVSYLRLSKPNTLFIQQYDNGGKDHVHTTEITSFPDYSFNAPDISLRFQPTPYLAIDNSGGDFDGRLYMSYTASEEENTDFFNIFLTYSDDNGQTWSTPKIVHNNQENEIQQFYSSIFVNDKGVLLIDWYDRKNYQKETKLTDFYLGVSYNGGQTFSELKLSSEPSDFNMVIPSSDDFGIGEYHQLVATDYHAISFWADGRTNDGDLDIYMAKVNINSSLVLAERTILSTEYSFSSLFPLPAKDVVYTNINLKKSTQIKYDIIDQKGKIISSSNWSSYPTGEHQFAINFNKVPKGIYFVKVSTSDGYFKTMKMVHQ